MVFLGEGAVSYERGTPVVPSPNRLQLKSGSVLQLFRTLMVQNAPSDGPRVALGGLDKETLLLTSDQVELQGYLAHKKKRGRVGPLGKSEREKLLLTSDEAHLLSSLELSRGSQPKRGASCRRG